MKYIVLNDVHIALGAKMVEFAGYNMPVTYAGLGKEHIAVRENVGIFDVSHMGEFRVKGPNALALLQKVTSNDVSKLVDGQVQYSCLPNETGGIVDDLLVYRINEEDYFLVVNASNIDKDWAHISKYNAEFNAELTNVSDDLSLFAIQGPNAAKLLQPLTELNLVEMKYYTFGIGKFAGVENVIVSATGYTGSGGFEVYVPNEYALDVWNTILDAGKEMGLEPCGLGARDTLRLEKSFCLYGHEIDDNTNPIEAGLGWITKFTKDFVGREFAEKLKQEGSKNKLIGFELTERGIPRQGYDIVNANGETIGRVTSGTQSPSLNKAIGLGYVPAEYAQIDTPIFIKIREKNIAAKVVKTPFL